MLLNLWKARAARRAKAESVYRSLMQQTRRPEFYTGGGVADSFEGRFDLLVIHVGLVLFRLKGEGADGKAMAQELFDLFFADMDAALRELGVGDTGVARRVRQMSEAFYGRLEAYDGALTAEDDGALRAAVARNLFGGEEAERPGQAAAMAGYMREAVRRLRETGLDGLVSDGLFPDPPDFGGREAAMAEGAK